MSQIVVTCMLLLGLPPIQRIVCSTVLCLQINCLSWMHRQAVLRGRVRSNLRVKSFWTSFGPDIGQNFKIGHDIFFSQNWCWSCCNFLCPHLCPSFFITPHSHIQQPPSYYTRTPRPPPSCALSRRVLEFSSPENSLCSSSPRNRCEFKHIFINIITTCLFC